MGLLRVRGEGYAWACKGPVKIYGCMGDRKDTKDGLCNAITTSSVH